MAIELPGELLVEVECSNMLSIGIVESRNACDKVLVANEACMHPFYLI